MNWNNLQEEYDTLGTMERVAELHKCSVSAVQKQFKRQGIVSHSRRLPIDWSDLAERYAGLGTFAALAEHYGCSIHAVQRAIKREGVEAKQRGLPKGYVWTDERREAHRLATHTPEFAQKSRENLLKRLPKMRGSSANSPLEKLLHGALLRAGLSFMTQQRKLDRYVVDIELTQAPVIIEADGAMHYLPTTKATDAERDAALTTAGYRVFRFTGTEINADPDACIALVTTTCELVADIEPVAMIYNGMVGKNNPNWSGGKTAYTCVQCGEAVYKRAGYRKQFTKTFCGPKCYTEWKRAHPEASPVHVRWANHRASEKVK